MRQGTRPKVDSNLTHSSKNECACVFERERERKRERNILLLSDIYISLIIIKARYDGH